MKQKLIVDVKESSLKNVPIIHKGIYGSVSLDNDSNLHKSYARKTSILKNCKYLERELRIMLRFHTNPFIVRASSHNIHYNTNSKGVMLCHIYMEFASLGNLNKLLSAGGALPEVSVRRATRMILQGLKALHSEGYVHCDLKPCNVLVFPSSTCGVPWELKLGGFGLSKEPTMDSRFLYPGTREYMPLECTDPNRFVGDETLVGPARDIWSLGRTVLEMFGAVPLDTGSSYKWRLHGEISPEATDFLRRCLTWRPTDRAPVDELLDHPFVAEKLPFYLSFLRFPSFIRKMATELVYGKHEELIPKPQGLDW
ncbi:hypothetical protein Bca4012_082029 [Brassica carinata]|uniref:Protein kinase domain-containing protein n=1 Tax=Brassica carinata TaxID=52824 RepID=A0A8X8AS44_BRACI|nr:hypothetical protein Bca52824_028790 [Brassica carinata]